LSASCIASIGGTGPDAVPTQTTRPLRFTDASDAANVSFADAVVDDRNARSAGQLAHALGDVLVTVEIV
jgi:hypothetical protein